MNQLIPTLLMTLLEALESAQTAPAPPQIPALRMLPEAAQIATMEPLANRAVRLDGDVFAMAPGVQLRDANNRIVLPGAIHERVLVRYLLDENRDVARVWVLSPAEAALSGRR